MKKQYIVQKYVLADSAAEAVAKAKRLPVHEVFLHGGWLEKAANFEFFSQPQRVPGFTERPKKHST